MLHKDAEAQVMPSRKKSPICAPRPMKERNNHGQSRNRYGILQTEVVNVLNTHVTTLQMTDACIFSLRPAEFAPF